MAIIIFLFDKRPLAPIFTIWFLSSFFLPIVLFIFQFTDGVVATVRFVGSIEKVGSIYLQEALSQAKKGNAIGCNRTLKMQTYEKFCKYPCAPLPPATTSMASTYALDSFKITTDSGSVEPV